MSVRPCHSSPLSDDAALAAAPAADDAGDAGDDGAAAAGSAELRRRGVQLPHAEHQPARVAVDRVPSHGVLWP